MNASELAEQLDARGSGSSSWIARCPAHADGSPSLSISEGDDGKILLNCFAGCTPRDVVAALGLTLSDLFREGSTKPVHRVKREPRPIITPPDRTVEIFTAFSNAFPLDDDSPGTRYLAKRGIPADLARRHGVGFVPDPRAATHWLLSRWPLADVQAAGLVNDAGNARFWFHRLLFPYWHAGNVFAMQCRRIVKGEGAKELSIGSFPVPWNRDSLDDLGKGSRAFLTEGVIDALSILVALEFESHHPPPWASDGWEPDPAAVVGIPGSLGFKPQWAPLFARLRPIIAFDPDTGGDKGTAAIREAFTDAGLPAPIRRVLPKDINDTLLTPRTHA